MEEQSNDKFEVTPEMLRELLGHVRDNIDELMTQLGFNHLNYSAKQLEVMEKLIDHKFPAGHQPKPTTVIPFAYYLGECIVRNVPGAKWEVPDTATAINEIAVNIAADGKGKGQFVYPFNRVWKYWGDRTDKLSTMLRMLMRMNEVELNPEYLKKRIGHDGWIQTYYGDVYRMFLAREDGKTPAKDKTFMQAMEHIAKKMSEDKEKGNDNGGE